MFGQHSRWGAELAAAEANAKGGVLGRKVEIDFRTIAAIPRKR